METEIKSKKNPVAPKENGNPLTLRPCVQLGLSIADLDLLSIGLVNDMYRSSNNDDFKYQEVATQNDFDRF